MSCRAVSGKFVFVFFFFNDTATTDIYTLSLHDALPICSAVRTAIRTTGLAVSFTAITLIAGIVMWVVLSDLRFQSDAALLLSVMVILNGAAAMLLVPAWVLVFKPKFICEAYEDEDGVIHADSVDSDESDLKSATSTVN